MLLCNPNGCYHYTISTIIMMASNLFEVDEIRTKASVNAEISKYALKVFVFVTAKRTSYSF